MMTVATGRGVPQGLRARAHVVQHRWRKRERKRQRVAGYSSRYWELAHQHLSKLEELAPDAYEGRYLMALFWYERGDPKRALQYGEKAKELWRGDATLRNLMGNILSSLGRLQGALEEYSAAVVMDPDQVAYEMNYEVLARRLGK